MSRKSNRLRPERKRRDMLASSIPSRSTLRVPDRSPSAVTQTENWNGSPCETVNGNRIASIAVSPTLGRSNGRTSIGTPASRARRAIAIGSRPFDSPSLSTSSLAGRLGSTRFSAVLTDPARSLPSGSISRENLLPSCLFPESSCSTRGSPPKVTTAKRSPLPRDCSRSRISPSDVAWFSGDTDRERSTTTTTSTPLPPMSIRGPARATTSNNNSRPRNQPVTPRTRNHCQ